MKTIRFEIDHGNKEVSTQHWPYVSDVSLERFKEIYSAASDGSIDNLDETLFSDYWFVLSMLQDILYYGE